MDYVQPLGGAAGDPYVDANPALAIEGSAVPAAALEHPMREIMSVITGAGMAGSGSDLTQLKQAIERMIDAQSGNYAIDTGAANAYVVAINPAIAAYSDGMTVRVKIVNANTGASTLNAGGGAVPLVNDVGGALVAGDLPAGGIVTATFISSANKFYVTSLVPSQLGSGKIIASLFTATRAVVNVSGDTTVMTLNFTLAHETPVVIDWRALFGGAIASICYGNARLMLGASQKSRSSRIHIGISGYGYVYNDCFVGSTYLGVLAAGSYTVSIIWFNETASAASFNPGPADASTWSQSDSEIIVRAAY